MTQEKDPSIVGGLSLRFYDSAPLESYSGSDWRKAFDRFLCGIWEQHDDSAGGVLVIDDVVLHLLNGTYKIRGPSSPQEHARPTVSRDRILAVHCDRGSVELGLMKFIRNNDLFMLVIEFPNSRFMFWKDRVRTNLHLAIVNRTF